MSNTEQNYLLLVDILYKAGWRDSADAQHTGIRASLPEIIAALSAQSAAQAQVEATLVHRDWKHTIASNPVMVLYTDSVNGEQVCRDDLWIATTSKLKDTHPSSAAQVEEIRNARAE